MTPPGPRATPYGRRRGPARMNAAAMSTCRMLSDLGYVVGPIALGIATDLFGADLTSGPAWLPVLVALAFMRLAPESFRPGRF